MRKRLIVALSTAMSFALIGGTLAYSPANADDDAVYTKVAEYTFADSANLGKDTSGKGNDLTAIGNPLQVKESDGSTAVQFDGESVLYAAGGGVDNNYDFADYLLDEEFTFSLDFYVSSTIPEGVELNGRGAIFTIWGFQYNDVNDFNSSSSAANYSTSSLTFESYSSGAKTVGLRYGLATAPNDKGEDYNPYWDGNYKSVTTDAWHTATFTWDPVTRETILTVDDSSWTKTARADNTFRSAKARFTLGGYYNEGAGGLKNNGATKTVNMVGKIKNVSLSTIETKGNAYKELISYDFASQNTLGKANVSAYDLVEWKANADGASATYDAEKDAMFSPVNSVLVPKGFAQQWYTENDFMDYLAGGSFTVSTQFMLPSAYQQKADARGIIFSLWGFWDNQSYGGGVSNLLSSAVMYDAYDSGASEANIRIGFLYDNGDNTENGWWSNKEGKISTDAFHTLTVSIDELNIVVYIDGARFASFTASEKNEWGNVNTSFAIGGAAGVGGVSNNSGEAYFKYFNVYDFAMSEAEMSKLYQNNLKKVSAAYITKADLVEGECSVTFGSSDEEILAAAPKGKKVTVTLSDESTAAASVIWTGVEHDGSDIYLVGEILGAGASNITNVKAKMKVTEETIESTPASVEWTFGETVTSSKGGIYELTSTKNTYTAEDGVLSLNGDALVSKKDSNGYDFMDYSASGDFTVYTSFKLPAGVNQDHVFALTLFGSSHAQAGVFILNNYGETAATTTLRIGFAYDSDNSSEGAENGFGSPYWTKYNTSVSIGAWNGLAISYKSETETVTVTLNGNEVCSYQVSANRIWKNADGGFALGNPGGNNQISYKALKFYDYAVETADLKTLSKAGVMPVAAATTVSETKAESVSSTLSLKVASELDEESALDAMQKSGKTVRVNLANGDLLQANVFWTTATANADGSYTVSGEIFGLYNPDGVKATATVSSETYKVSFTASNATVKVGETAVTETTAAYGSTVSFKVEAAEGYEIVSVKVGDSELTATDGVYELTNVTAATTVTIETQAVKKPASNKKVGCGSVIGSASLGFVALAAAAIFTKKRKNED